LLLGLTPVLVLERSIFALCGFLWGLSREKLLIEKARRKSTIKTTIFFIILNLRLLLSYVAKVNYIIDFILKQTVINFKIT
jgi:hypothetical protein